VPNSTIACPAQELAIEYGATKRFAVFEGPPSSCGGLNPAAPQPVRRLAKRARRIAVAGNDRYFISPSLFKLIGEQLPVRLPMVCVSPTIRI
jgi:hypothetical protein